MKAAYNCCISDIGLLKNCALLPMTMGKTRYIFVHLHIYVLFLQYMWEYTYVLVLTYIERQADSKVDRPKRSSKEVGKPRTGIHK
jgi:hypothetical protein